jgi:hypothetical protein
MSNSNSLLTLNDDILEHLYTFLSPNDQVNLSEICQRLYALSRMGLITSLNELLPPHNNSFRSCIIPRIKKLDLRNHSSQQFQDWFRLLKKKALRNVYTMELRLIVKLAIKVCQTCHRLSKCESCVSCNRLSCHKCHTHPHLSNDVFCVSCTAEFCKRCSRCKKVHPKDVVDTLSFGLDTMDICQDCDGLQSVLNGDVSILSSFLTLWDAMSLQ